MHDHCDAGPPSPTVLNLMAKLTPTAKLIKPSGEVTPVEPKNGTDFSLEELNEFVGGYIQVIRPPNMPGVIMVINEEGKLKGLAHNAIASKFWHPHDDIVGNALLCHAAQVK